MVVRSNDKNKDSWGKALLYGGIRLAVSFTALAWLARQLASVEAVAAYGVLLDTAGTFVGMSLIGAAVGLLVFILRKGRD